MNLSQLFSATETVGDQTVPEELFGCWKRNWIRFGDEGELERDVSVVWLQTASGMGDLRIDPRQRPEQTDSSCGITVVDQTTTPYATADWLNGDRGFAQQTVSNFPEKGWLDWQSESLLYELAPSGAYVEEWEKLDESGVPVIDYQAIGSPTPTNLYIAGNHALLAVHRGPDETLHEYSYGVWTAGATAVLVELSTRAERVGQNMELDFDWRVVSAR